MDRQQTLIGLAGKGTSPKGTRRVPAAALNETQLTDAILLGLTPCKRLPSGPSSKDEPEKSQQEYLEFQVDLVECGERLCPGSSEWEKNHLLWALAQPFLPTLDVIREELARLKWSLRLSTPSPHQREAMTNERAFYPANEAEARYSRSLAPLSGCIDVQALSLLAGLVAESHIVDDEKLLNIHKDHFMRAVELLLQHKWMADIRKPFERLISSRFLLCSWESPAVQHRTSIHAPFVSIDEWERQTGISGLRGHDW